LTYKKINYKVNSLTLNGDKDMTKKQTRIEDEELEVKTDREVLLEVAETIHGDMRDRIVDVIRGQQKPWQQLTEKEQNNVCENIEKFSQSLISQAVKLISSRCSVSVIVGKVDKVTNTKDCVQAMLKVEKSSQFLHELFDSQGTLVTINVIKTDGLGIEETDRPVDFDQPVFDSIEDVAKEQKKLDEFSELE
jgi:lipopolysaccharide biosynthesis glycosyltransferase